MEPIAVNKKLKRTKFWMNITNNLHAGSCKDAANKRNRLGNTGIPLSDELKSNFIYYVDEDGTKKYVLLHCRGNQLIDSKKVEKIIGYKFYRISIEHLKEKFNLKYGLVNPVNFIDNHQILQIFDISVFMRFLPPYTMMTNAGHYEKGMEFYPTELINKLHNNIVADIIEVHTFPDIHVHKIGILTGNSPDSGIMLWEKINFYIRSQLRSKFLGDISFPHVIVESLPEMGLSMELELREKETKHAVLEGIERLCKNGASLICIACNTTQYFEKEISNICKDYGSTFIPMKESIKLHLDKNGIRKFDFLGIKYVTDFKKWSAFKSLKKDFSINLPDPNILSQINELAFEVKKNRVSAKGINKLRDLINNSTKNNDIVIALTELSILLASQTSKKKSTKNYIDTLSVLAERIATIYVTEIKKAYTIPKSK